MRTLLQDLRYGVRMVRRQPTFSLVVILTLALAIGANTVIFSFANILMLRPLPLKDSDTLGVDFRRRSASRRQPRSARRSPSSSTTAARSPRSTRWRPRRDRA